MPETLHREQEFKDWLRAEQERRFGEPLPMSCPHNGAVCMQCWVGMYRHWLRAYPRYPLA